MWEINVSDQVASFLYAVVLGCMLCVFYDIIRALRKAEHHGTVAVFFGDLIFWIVSAFAVFLFLIARTNGAARGYVFVAALTGFILFRITVSRFLFKVLLFVFRRMHRFLKWITAVFSTLVTVLNRVFDVIGHFCNGILKNSMRTAKKLLKYVYRMMYTKRNRKSSEQTGD